MKFTLVFIAHNVFGLEFLEDLSSILVICLKDGVTAFSGRATCLCYNNKFILLYWDLDTSITCLLLGKLNSVASTPSCQFEEENSG